MQLEQSDYSSTGTYMHCMQEVYEYHSYDDGGDDDSQSCNPPEA